MKPGVVVNLVLCAVQAGCAVVPIVQPAGTKELSVQGLPPDSRAVEVVTDDEVVLRGLFVPAGDDASVVLHLLPSGVSATTGLGWLGGFEQMLATLRASGYASLVIDYRGVGASDGKPDPERLPDDAQAMWAEALRCAGGDSARVILRASSLGGLAAASLLDGGARPRGFVLFAPIRAETIARHAPRHVEGAFLGTLHGWFLRRPVDVDLVATLRSGVVPTLVFLPESDAYLPEEEMALVRAALAASGDRLHRFAGDHFELVARAYGQELSAFSGRVEPELLDEEREFLDGLGG